MNNRVNPFITIGYVSKEYFFDREAELVLLTATKKQRSSETGMKVIEIWKI
jgi:hypothetical protein